MKIPQFLGYINEVRIWNVAKSQAEIRSYMGGSLPSPTTQTGLVAYYTFDNLLNKQGNAAFDGTINGAAAINQTNPNCNFVADSCAIIPTTTPCDIKEDFNYKADLCSPLSITFQSSAVSYNAIKWDMGDGNVITAGATVSNLYTTAGNYTISMIVDKGTCMDTVIKKIYYRCFTCRYYFNT